jgi:hypothetical protein
MVPYDEFGVRADHSGDTEKALNIMLQNGDRAAAAVFIEEVRARHPEFGDELVAKYAKGLDR